MMVVYKIKHPFF